jgi:putative transposase
MEVHSGIGMAPARKWREGIAKKGQPLVRDVRIFDKVFGFTKDCVLSAEGVFYDGERFHDPDVTTTLLSDLIRHAKEREQRNGVTSSKTVKVMVTANPGNADHVHVRNPRTGEQVKLPNWNMAYAKGTPWHVLKKVRAFAKKENLAFHSDEDKAAARVAFMEAMGRALPGHKFAEKRKLAPLVDPRPDLVPGNSVAIFQVEDGQTIIHDLADEASDAERQSVKSPRRGGKAATERAMRTRAAKQKAKVEKPASTVPRQPDPTEAPAKPMAPVEDPSSRLKAMIEKIKKGEKNG